MLLNKSTQRVMAIKIMGPIHKNRKSSCVHFSPNPSKFPTYYIQLCNCTQLGFLFL